MGFIDEYLDTYRQVLTSPTEFFESENQKDGFGFPLKFALVNIAISGVIASASIAAFGTASSALQGSQLPVGVPVIAGAVLILTPVLGILGLMISSGLIHIFVSLLGGEKGYNETLAVMEYATAIQPLTSVFNLIPLVGGLFSFVLGIYGVFIQAKGLNNFQSLSFGRSIAAILLPVIIVVGIVVAISFVLVAGSIAAMGA
jgi:hypothetical protein